VEGHPAGRLRQVPEHAGLRLGIGSQDRWFIPDGIHYTSAGYAARAMQVADVLVRAFPASGHNSGCVVR
jgi:lysophospholipase L1-like esterase